VLAVLLLAQTNPAEELAEGLGALLVSLFTILLPGIIALMLVKAFVKLVRM